MGAHPEGRSEASLCVAHDAPIALEDIGRVAAGAGVILEPATARLLDDRRDEIVASLAAKGEPAYGFNRGFGHNVDVSVPAERLEALQLNLVRSHAAGVGPAAPEPVVRATMLLRARSLALGHSGVRSCVVRGLVDLLQHRVTPVVPLHGSVGASGDLAPLAHIALVLVGEGEVLAGPEAPRIAAAAALADAGLSPLRLQAKEGLALTNGVQFSTALASLACLQLETLLRTAALTTALSAQALLASDTPFEADLHALRPHPGSVAVAAWIWRLMAGSPIRAAHVEQGVDWEVQDPYSLRCAAQVLGACHDLLADARRTLEIEANSATDNPLLLTDADGRCTRVVSGGHFHGMPVATRTYGLLQAAAIITSLSNARCARYVDEDRNRGLGADLIWPALAPEDRAASSGMMIPEYVSAALANNLWGVALPSHLLSVPTDAGQEDHVSMSAGLAVRLWETLPRVAEALAVELAMASQAAAIRARSTGMTTKRELTREERAATEDARRRYADALCAAVGDPAVSLEVGVHQSRLWPREQRAFSPPCEAALAAVRESLTVVEEDRSLSAELAALARRVASGEILAAAERVAPLGA